MNTTKILFPAMLIVLMASGCAQQGTVGKNEAAERYLNSWVTVQKTKHPEYKWQQTELGCWILEETAGAGAAVGAPDEFPYIRYEITTYDLQGNITSTTSEALSHKLNNYERTKFYGPSISYRANNSLYAGVEELLSGMKVGGYMKALIPGWLMTYNRYGSAAAYKENVTGTDAIYEFTIVESIADIKQWELDSLGRYITASTPLNPADSLKEGFYYIRTKAPSVDREMPSDTTVYINYTGRLLNGLVFDTTVADTAKLYGLDIKSRTFAPVKIKWASEHTSITMGSSDSSVKEGFSYALFQMKPYEKCRAIFWSGLGYEGSGSGTSIPGWSPLIFDIELVDKQ